MLAGAVELVVLLLLVFVVAEDVDTLVVLVVFTLELLVVVVLEVVVVDVLRVVDDVVVVPVPVPLLSEPEA